MEGDDVFPTFRASNRKMQNEKQRRASIITSTALNEISGAKKNTIAIVAHCHIFSWAKAPSCTGKQHRLDINYKRRANGKTGDRENKSSKKHVQCEKKKRGVSKLWIKYMVITSLVIWWASKITQTKQQLRDMMNMLLGDHLYTVSCLNSIPINALSCVIKTPSPMPNKPAKKSM